MEWRAVWKGVARLIVLVVVLVLVLEILKHENEDEDEDDGEGEAVGFAQSAQRREGSTNAN
jgi:hypothetical protein